MPNPERFKFQRTRGIVWVCDIEQSSKHLNSDASADALEKFLPRLHWVSTLAVHAVDGEFCKWTGDGFLAWFEVKLHRNLVARCEEVLRAAYDLTFLVNVTQLGVDTPQPIRIRHGITYEQDALVTRITYTGGLTFSDITGRAVVLAFRLTGVPSDFPNVVVQGELAAISKDNSALINFKHWRVSSEDNLKYFKGEAWGTSSLYVSADKKSRKYSLRTAYRKAVKVVSDVENPDADANADLIARQRRFAEAMENGPAWARAVMRKQHNFLKTRLLGSLKKIIVALEADVSKQKNSKKSDRKAQG